MQRVLNAKSDGPNKSAEEKTAARTYQIPLVETGGQLGIPMFLQRRALSAIQLSLIELQPLEEEKERLQIKSAQNNAQRPPLEEEELFQTQLTVGAADDEYEREADRVADRIMSRPETQTPEPQTEPRRGHSGAPPVTQTGSSTSPLLKRDNLIATKSDQTNSPKRTKQVLQTIQSPGAGSGLPAHMRNRLEPALGHNLGSVRVHNDSAAHRAAKSLFAKAYTHKDHIYLGAGQRVDDLRLMAHEAAHVVQQRSDPITGSPTSNVIRRQTAQELIEEYTNWGGLNLREEDLGARLANFVRAGRYDFVIEVIDTLNWTNRDDVAGEMMNNLSTPDLIRIARNENGAALLRRVSDVLTDWWGWTSRLERQQGNLITAIIGDEFERNQYNREIIRGLKEQADSDFEALALLFESDDIVDDGTVSGRLTVVLSATEHLLIPGLQTGIDFEDEGFAPEFRDPHPSSRNQVGHFLTAVGLQFTPDVVSRDIPFFGRIRDMVEAPASMDDQEVALRLTIGHEKAPDPNGRMAAISIALRGLVEYGVGGPEGETEEEETERVGRAVLDETRRQINDIIRAFRVQFHATTDADVEAWNAALEALGREDRLDRNAMEGPLNRIVVDPTLRGNSREDLRLSLIGWRLGQKFSNNEFSNRAQVARWIRLNLGPRNP